MSATRGCIKPIDYQRLFNQTNSPNVINCYIDECVDEQEEINRILFGAMGSDQFSLVAQCQCGWITSNAQIGSRCPHCNTLCSTARSSSSIFPFKNWIALPEGVRFLHPLLMEHLIRYFPIEKSKKKVKHQGKNNKSVSVNFMDYVLNLRLTELPKAMVDIPYRGMTDIVANLDEFMAWVVSKLTPQRGSDLNAFYQRYRDLWIMERVPLIDQSLHMINPNGDPSDITKAYLLVDSTTKDIKAMYAGLCNLEKDRRNRIINKRKNYKHQIDARLYKIYKAYLNYNFGLLYDKVRPKEGLIRSSLIGSRWHYSGRTVSAPITGIHYYDEIYLPWSMAVVIYKSFIVNHLTKRYRFTQSEALRRQEIAIENTDDRLIEHILNDILAEYKLVGLKGGPVIIDRNPSIRHLALQLGFVTKILKSRVLHYSSMIWSRPNTDSDGDTASLFFIRETGLVKQLAGIHPSTAMVSGRFANIPAFLKVHSTVTVNSNNYLKNHLMTAT